jgi:putative peptidoglycan lipid II flippase
MALLRSVTTIASLTMVSRLFGMVRDMIMAAFLGAGPIADAFFVAFRLPNFFRSMFAEGAFSSAFVPRFADVLTQKGRAEAFIFAEHILSFLVVALAIIVSIGEIIMPWLMRVIAPGYQDDPVLFALVVDLARITFPYLLLISLVAFQGGMLNSIDRFSSFAASPIIMNVVMAIAIMTLTPYLDNAGYAAAWGVIFSGFAQWGWMHYSCRKMDIHLRPKWPHLTPDVKQMLKAMAPAAIGSGAIQINLLIGIMIASLLPQGSVSYLYYADRLNQLPLGVVGIAVSTALLPLLSKAISRGDTAGAIFQQNRAIQITWLLTLPATLALIVMPLPIINVLFVRGAFTALDAEQTAFALAGFALGLPAYVLVKALTPGFFARGDTATPVKIAFICVAINTILNLMLIGLFKHIGIAVGTSIASWINAGLLTMALHKRGYFALDTQLKRSLPRMLGAALAMAAVLLVLQNLLDGWIYGAGFISAIFTLLFLVLAGMASYGAFCLLFKATSTAELKSLWRKAETPI